MGWEGPMAAGRVGRGLVGLVLLGCLVGADAGARCALPSPPMRLRGGADVEVEVEVEAVTGAPEGQPADAGAGGMSRKELEAEVAKLVAGDMPSFVKEKGDFQHVIRILNTNIEGKRTVLYALTKIKGVGRRFGDVMLKRAGIDKRKRAGELSAEEIEKVVQVLANPQNYDIPSWMFNRRKDYKTGKDLHLNTNSLDLTFREDMDRLRKARVHRGLRHMLGWKVRGQHTKTTGRGGVVIASKKPQKK